MSPVGYWAEAAIVTDLIDELRALMPVVPMAWTFSRQVRIQNALHRAANALEAERKQFAEHQRAWRANSAWHTDRITALEAQVQGMKKAQGADELNGALQVD